MKKNLAKQAIIENIEKQTFEELSACCKKTMLDFPKEEISTIIESVDNRVHITIKAKGQRIKY